MLFNSIEFLIFFPVVVALYFLLPYRLRRYFLLAASLRRCCRVALVFEVIHSAMGDPPFQALL